MKIQTSVRELYEEQLALNRSLKTLVDGTIQALRESRWHYESRIKGLESFALKLESGRFSDPRRLEDFLAGTIVVPTSTDIPRVEAILCSRFTLDHRKPPSATHTSKAANSFPFDDLRLYLRRGNDGSRPAEPFDDVLFEIQVKTFLQHAWGIATHDLSYKTDEVRWGKDRIVGHLKASIEYAEIAILEAELLSKSSLLDVVHEPTVRIADIIDILNKFWTRENLPNNLRGLAMTLDTMLAALNMSAGELDLLLQDEQVRGGGALPLNLSPYAVVVQALVRARAADVDAAIRRSRLRLLLTPEITLPAGFPSAAAARRIVNIIGSSSVTAS